ncbi:MAG: branched-chain amino acid ABC transporter permease [Halobacteriaceae archaeon]
MTLAISIVATQIAVSWRSVLGGFEGIMGIPTLQIGIPYVWMIPIDGWFLYYFSLSALLVVYWFTMRTINSPFGAVVQAIDQKEEKARALGYNTKLYKSITFSIGSGIAGMGGALFATYNGFVNPAQLGFMLSTTALLWVLVGGRGTIIGAIIGTILLTLFENSISGVFQYTWSLLMGLALVAIVLLYPGGIMGLVDIVERRLQKMLT